MGFSAGFRLLRSGLNPQRKRNLPPTRPRARRDPIPAGPKGSPAAAEMSFETRSPPRSADR
jgi:hypothetical protein